MYHQPNRSRNSPCRNMLSCRPKGRSAPLACCLPHAGGWKCGQGQATRRGPVAEGSCVEGLTVAEGSLVEGLPVAERARPLTALQAAGTKPGAKRRAQIRTAACRGTPMPRCQGGCHLAGASLKSSTNTNLAKSVELETGEKDRTCCEGAAGPVDCRGERWMDVSIR